MSTRLQLNEPLGYRRNEVAQLFRVNVHTVDMWVQRGWLDTIKIGRGYVLITTESLNRLLDSRRVSHR
jgi:hypothetical protein